MAIADVRESERDLLGPGHRRFGAAMARHGLGQLARAKVTTLQINVGKRCNQACHHCHVEAGPKRTEVLTQRTAERLMALVDRSPSIDTVDITGGAPELNPSFNYLVQASKSRGKHVIVRHNLTVLFESEMGHLPALFRQHQLEIVASLPCYSQANVDAQRGKGVFTKSVRALRLLNALGYGKPETGLVLNLVYNPGGPFLPPAQASLEARYKQELRDAYGVEFNSLFTITNMPIKRFAHQLLRDGHYAAYMTLLTQSFNPANVDALMCRNVVSISWDGRMYDCDFNQMLDLELGSALATGGQTIWELDSFDALDSAPVATGSHCFGCTAGAGSSCGGTLSVVD